jgi:hypothetical protein
MAASSMSETENTIYPTNTCFDDALDLIASILKAHPHAAYTDEFVLVHAICVHPDDGHDFSHAWVEDNPRGRVLAMGIYKGERIMVIEERPKFYAELKPKDVTKYTPREAWQENKRTMHYGPWKEQYLKLCRDKMGAA